MITHAANQGKWRALKTDFNYILNVYPDVLAIVVVLSSAFLVSSINRTFLLNKTITKIVVDVSFFFINFVNQRECVFAKGEINNVYYCY